MKESQKMKIKEKAKDWGCKIEDEMSFYHHYNDYRAYTIIGSGIIFFMIIILLGLLI